MEINVDIGGTFTDCFALDGDRVATAKALTTHHDLAQGFMTAVGDLAKVFGTTTDDVLKRTSTIRYATTLGTNALIERTGPKLGIITTKGFEDVVPIGRCRSYGDGMPAEVGQNLAKAQRPEPLVPRSMIVGVRERVDSYGKVAMRLHPEEVRDRVLDLVDKGARGFVVSLLWSFKNPDHELAVREIIEEEFPAAYLGRFPVILSHEVSKRSGEYVRTMTSVLDAYLHRFTSDRMSALRDRLIEQGYRGNLLLVHNTGGMGSLARTTPLRTIHAGPVAGLFGAHHIAESFDFDKIVTADMGGTSFDVGVVVKGSVRFYEFNPVIDRWRVQIPMMDIKAVGAGGGSIASYDEFKGLQVGPKSASSSPGPASYGFGGTEPTTTDADLVLGYLNPEYYHGGELQLDRRRAERAIQRRVADPMGITVREAAAKIRQVIDSNMANAIFKEVVLKGYDPREFTIFAYGGGGPLHACGYAELLQIPKVVVPPNSPVFSASGAAGLDLLHIYEKSEHIVLFNPLTKKLFDDFDFINGMIDGFIKQAYAEFADEGHVPDDVVLQLELDVRSGGQIYLTTFKSPVLRIASRSDLALVLKAYFAEYADRFGDLALTSEVGVSVETVRIKASVPRSHWKHPKAEPATETTPALKEPRDCYWPSIEQSQRSPVYIYESFQPGHRVEGPAVVEGQSTTIALYPGWAASMDEHGFLILTREETQR